jgi:DNA-binding CsgD family transcriptional regulator
MNILTVNVEPDKHGMFHCPECATAGTLRDGKPVAFKDTAHLGIHRRGHGIIGPSKPAIANRNSRRGGFRKSTALDAGKQAQIFALTKQGMSIDKVAAQLNISTSTVFKYRKGTKVHGKVGRPKGSKSIHKPFKLSKPIVLREEDLRPGPIVTYEMSIADRLREMSLRIASVGQELTNIINLISLTRKEE